MNNVEHIVKTPVTGSLNMSNLVVSGVSLGGSEEKKIVPKLFVPPSAVLQTSSSSTVVNKELINEPINSSASSFSVPKITATGSLSQNGKIVHVQPSSQNSVYIGTLLRSSPKGHDIIPQKVLLAAVKPSNKDGLPSSPMARLILPRPSANSTHLNPSTTKPICRPFNMIPQGTLIAPTIVKTSEGNKIIQPNIIRQRAAIDGKLIATSSGIPISGGIIVPGKSPPTLALIKPSKVQSSERQAKIVVLDLNDSKEKSQPENPESLPVEISSSGSESNDVSGNEKKTSEPEIEPKMDLAEDNCEIMKKLSEEKKTQLISSPVKELEQISSDQPSAIEKPAPENSSISKPMSDPIQPATPASVLKDSSPPPLVLREKSIPELAPLTQTVPSLILKENSPVGKEGVPRIEGRARKRKGTHSSTVSSTSKARAVINTYENMKLLPGAEDLNPFTFIEWDEYGIGMLPESEIEVILNEFGMIELNASVNQLENNRHGKLQEAEEIFCCVQCHCYGLISEFFNESYCSVSCKEELIAQQLSLVNLEDLEPINETGKDKKKIAENSNMKQKVFPNDDKYEENEMEEEVAEKEVDLEEEAPLSEEQIPIEIPDSPSPPRKSFPDSTVSKIKKILPKVNKPLKPNRIQKSPPIPNPPNQEKETPTKSKIKLRPRTGGKINKSSEEIIAQDLYVGPPATEKAENSKKQSGFRWNDYIKQSNSSAVWVKLFDNPYPCRPNRFKVGQRLEAIDPEHQSYFCLVSVTEVKGYRLKLHFDGYPTEYDFWAYADSPNIFPPEFCSNHGIPLHPPPGISMRSFDWNTYLSRINAQAAPSTLFETSANYAVQTNLFKVDMKLEAVDRKNTFLVCVSTVAAVMENRILIHFDSWGDLYDYWVDVSSPYIRPVGWCQSNNHELTPPNGIKPENFSWKKYLKDTKSIPAPEKAFYLRPPIEFQKGLKLEVVDKRAPHLIRVATISAVLPYQVHITFDGFPKHFGYWVDDDCPDIHPVGWASRAGHPLEPPPSAEDFLNAPCKTPGCVGQGHLRGTKYESHTEFEDCPYATEHLTKDTALTDRLKWSNVKYKRYGEEFCTVPDDSDEESDEDIENIRWSWLSMRQNASGSPKRISEEEQKNLYGRRVANKNKINHSSTQMNKDIKSDCTTDCVTDSEEIKRIFGPSSPIPIINDERESGFDNKTDHEDSEENQPVKQESQQTKDSPSETKEERIKKEEIKEEFMEEIDSLVKENIIENTNVSIKEDIKPIVIKNEEEQNKTGDYTNESHDSADIPMSDLYQKSPKKESEEERPCNNSYEKNSESQLLPKDKLFGSEDYLEEKNALRWTIKQVSQYTRPLLTNCSHDCFLEEGIDGPGLLMLNKNDLLEYLGLSDIDAERVFRKISMLRQKVI